MSNDRTASSLPGRLNIAWAVLVVATGIGWKFGHHAQGGTGLDRIALGDVIMTAFAKAWIVGAEFMELRLAPRWLRHGYEAWVCGICVALLWICLR